MLVLFCQTCCKGFTTYQKWIAHLLSPVHQKKARNKIKDWSKKLQSRGVIFTEFCKPKEVLDEDVIAKLAWSVSEHTIISDLYFDCDKQVCVILIDEKKGADYIVGMTELEAGVCKPFKRLAADILESDWEIIFKKSDKKKQSCKDLSESHDVRENAGIDLKHVHVVSKTEPAVIEISSEDENECSLRNNVQNGGNQVSENSFAEDVPLEDHFVTTDNSVLESYNDSFITKDYEAQELESNGQTNDIDGEFAVFMKENMLSKTAAHTRNRLVGLLTKMLKASYKNVKVYPFEEGLTKLNFLKTSSLAVGIDINRHFNYCDSAVVLPKPDMIKIRNLLCEKQPDGTPFCVNLHKNIFQRGFTLNFTHCRSKIECECFFFQKMSQQKWKFVSACMEIDPRVLPLTQLLVSWYEKFLHDLTKEQSAEPNKFLVYYPFVQLVIYFLIYKGILPTMQIWRNGATNTVIKNLNVGFCEDVVDILRRFEQPQECVYSKNDSNELTGHPSAKCILALATEFFEFFGEVDLEKNIVSLPLAELVDKKGLLGKFKGKTFFRINSKLRESKMKLRRSYRRLTKNSKSIMPTSIVIQDSCDDRAYEFSQQWSKTSLSEFQNLCCCTSLAMKNFLSGNSSLRDLCRFFPIDLKTDDDLNHPWGFVSQKKIVVKSTCFNIPRQVMIQLKTKKVIKRFWFRVLREFFDEVLEGVLKLHVKSTHVENEERHNYSKVVEPDTDENIEETVPKKKRKGNNGSAISKDNQVSVKKSLSKLPYGGLYIKTYFAESRCSKLIFGLSSRKKPKGKDSINENPLANDKIISGYLMDDETENATEMTCKILIDCNTLLGGIHIEAPCSDRSVILKLREIISYVSALAKTYTVYRMNECLNDPKRKQQL